MKKQIALGLVAGVIALASTAFAPPEAQARDNKQQLNQLAMQMYMQNMANQQNLAAQQQLYGNQYPYNLNNPNLNNAYLNQLYNNQLVNNANFNNGRGCNGNAYGQYKRKFKRNKNAFFNNANNFVNGNRCGNGFNNGFNNGNFNNVGYNNGLLNNVGNGLFGNNYNPYNNNFGYSQSTVGRLLNRIF
ncbi:MAG TPA: hypothetical protein EYN91_03325 [Candidatus Melainabacteria bacterium]|jgi:hypothetical protein|nr:hypothetical protein [Candidatus Melainabacteria bacterium]HIN66999.1 hypothetical protein [Candidatus Obscuribacterales bacterium]